MLKTLEEQASWLPICMTTIRVKITYFFPSTSYIIKTCHGFIIATASVLLHIYFLVFHILSNSIGLGSESLNVPMYYVHV